MCLKWFRVVQTHVTTELHLRWGLRTQLPVRRTTFINDNHFPTWLYPFPMPWHSALGGIQKHFTQALPPPTTYPLWGLMDWVAIPFPFPLSRLPEPQHFTQLWPSSSEWPLEQFSSYVHQHHFEPFQPLIMRPPPLSQALGTQKCGAKHSLPPASTRNKHIADFAWAQAAHSLNSCLGEKWKHPQAHASYPAGPQSCRCKHVPPPYSSAVRHETCWAGCPLPHSGAGALALQWLRGDCFTWHAKALYVWNQLTRNNYELVPNPFWNGSIVTCVHTLTFHAASDYFFPLSRVLQ